jgi:hypothetical protein
MGAVEQVKLFSVHSGSVYVRDTEHFVSKVKDGSITLTQAFSTSLSSGQWYFDAKSKKLYVRVSDSSDPKTRSLALTYKLFYSTAPIVMPHDLDSGEDVEWEPLVSSIGSIGQQLDEESTGIVLESSSSVSMINNHGYFDEIFDTLIWENQPVEFYSYIAGTPISEIKKIFNGVIESKDFSVTTVNFKVKDFIFRLRDFVSLGRFSSLDGNLDPSMIDRPKRRIYGQVKQLKCTGVDKVLGGTPLSGTISGLFESDQISGTGFLSQLSPSDELIININGEDKKISIQSVESDTSATLGTELDINLANQTDVTINHAIPPRSKNRLWHVAGHKLRSPTATITSIISENRYVVDDTSDIYAGDQIEINGDLISVRRVSGDEIVLENAVSPLPSVSDEINKLPIQNVFVGSTEYIYSRDWTFSNTTEAIIDFNDLAEFNVADERSLGVTILFTNGSRLLETTSVVDFRSILKPNDWIRSSLITEPTYYEILEVKEQSILLRTAFSGITSTKAAKIKVIETINDNSIVTCNCLGIEVDGEWIKTPSDAVRHLVLNDAELTAIDEDSFIKANADCDYILSLPIPENMGESEPLIRDVVTKINQSVFGSLCGNASLDIAYNILNARKPQDTQILKDDDIISFDSSSTQRIINNIKVNYRPFTDIFSGESAFESYSKTSDFVNNLIGIKSSSERTLYLYEDDKARIIAQRILLFNSLPSTVVTVKAKLNLALLAVSDKMFLSLDRLYKRYGGKDKRKIGTITGVKKNGFDTDIIFTDLGNVYNRIPAIAPNDTLDYSAQIKDDLIRYGYILDNDVLTPDPTSEVSLGNNIIG